MLAGNLASIGVGGIIAVVWSYIVSVTEIKISASNKRHLSQSPDNFDFNITRAINKPVHHHHASDAIEVPADEKGKTSEDRDDSDSDTPDINRTEASDLDPVALNKAFRFAVWSSVGLVRSSPAGHLSLVRPADQVAQLLVLIILIPLPLFFAQTVYGEAGFAAWVSIGIIWAFLAAFIVVLYPLYESRVALKEVSAGVIKASSPRQLL
jgi:hypothetical protein